MAVMDDPSRRRFLKSLAAAPMILSTAGPLAEQPSNIELVARKSTAALVGQGYPDSEIWGYNGQVPGPVIRVRQGVPLHANVLNELDQPTTVHWHGLRIDNSMDGVPGLTQQPIEPGGSFAYTFTPPDAGTFWYHSHVNSAEQIGRGLYGALIVEEADSIKVDRDVVWVLDDWLLNKQAQLVDNFDNPRSAAHGGQIGNTVTINGRITDEFRVRAGERIRLRLINAANGRIFRLAFTRHRPVVVALDGQPAVPHEPAGGYLVLGPAMRADLVLDLDASPGQSFSIVDEAYRQSYELVSLVYEDLPAIRSGPADDPIRIPPNRLPEPDLDKAEHLEVTFGGGVHGRMERAQYQGEWMDLRALFQRGKMWAINGIVGESNSTVPMFRLKLGASYILNLTNQSAWSHPIHLHGHHFRLLNHNGSVVPNRPWLDTVLLGPNEKAEIALVADNPGDWMFHCHIPEHMFSGMTSIVRVV